MGGRSSSYLAVTDDADDAAATAGSKRNHKAVIKSVKAAPVAATTSVAATTAVAVLASATADDCESDSCAASNERPGGLSWFQFDMVMGCRNPSIAYTDIVLRALRLTIEPFLLNYYCAGSSGGSHSLHGSKRRSDDNAAVVMFRLSQLHRTIPHAAGGAGAALRFVTLNSRLTATATAATRRCYHSRSGVLSAAVPPTSGGSGGSSPSSDAADEQRLQQKRDSDLSAEERRRLKQIKDNRRRQTSGTTAHRTNTKANNPLSAYSFSAPDLKMKTNASAAAAAATSTAAASGPAVRRSLFGEVSGEVAYQCYRPLWFRALTGVGITSTLIWSLIGTTTTAMAAVSAPTIWNHPAWTGLGFVASVMYLSVTYGVARRTVAELIWLSNGDTRVITHGLLWGTHTFDVAPHAISMQPLSNEALGAKKLTCRIPGASSGSSSVAGKGQQLIIDVRTGSLVSASAMRHIFQWDGNIHAPGGGGNPIVIDQFTEKVFGVNSPK